MKQKRKTIIQRIKNESGRFFRKVAKPLQKRIIGKRWLSLLSNAHGEPVKCIDGMAFVLGDSHSNFFGGVESIQNHKLFQGVDTSPNLIPFFSTFHIGPGTAFGLGREEGRVQARKKASEIIDRQLIPPGSLILLSFGEIDCRAHVLRESSRQQRSVEDITSDAIENYMCFAEWLVQKGFKIGCWAAIASIKCAAQEDGDFPVYGTEIERNRVTRIFNQQLERECRLRGFLFCSIFEELLDDQMETRSEYISLDNCHLSQRAAPLLAKALLQSGIITVEAGRATVSSVGYTATHQEL